MIYITEYKQYGDSQKKYTGCVCYLDQNGRLQTCLISTVGDLVEVPRAEDLFVSKKAAFKFYCEIFGIESVKIPIISAMPGQMEKMR